MGSNPRTAESLGAGHFSGLWRRRPLRRCSSFAGVEPSDGACADRAGRSPMAGVAGAMEKISPPPYPCRPARATTSRLIVPRRSDGAAHGEQQIALDNTPWRVPCRISSGRALLLLLQEHLSWPSLSARHPPSAVTPSECRDETTCLLRDNLRTPSR